MTLPLLDLHAQHDAIREELEAVLARVLAHGRFISGPEVAEFEDAFAAYCDVPHCIGVANGTAAIELVLRAAGIGAGETLYGLAGVAPRDERSVASDLLERRAV